MLRVTRADVACRARLMTASGIILTIRVITGAAIFSDGDRENVRDTATCKIRDETALSDYIYRS